MNKDEVKIAIDWAAQEGWNPGLNDAECFYSADENGFLCGVLEDEIIATKSAVNYDDVYGFMGLYIVKKGFRGKKYGLPIWYEGLKKIEHTNVAMDGVVEQQHNYKKNGFKLAYTNIRFEGRGNGSKKIVKGIDPEGNSVLNKIIEYDRKYFPATRNSFLKNWINQPTHNSFISSENGEITGWAVLRKCRIGYKIGPLYAENILIAEKLIDTCLATADFDLPVYLDIPEVNSNINRLIKKYNLSKVFECGRMYTGEIPNINLNNLYGVTTFELG